MGDHRRIDDGGSGSHFPAKASAVWRSALVVLAVLVGLGPAPDESAVKERLDRVREYHGAAGPWAVAGYRIGERALGDLGLPRRSFSLLVVHRCPAQVQYSCMADGLQAATGASPGKLNLRVEEATAEGLRSVVEDRKSERRLTFTLRPKFVKSIRDLPPARLEAEGERVAALPDKDIFLVEESKVTPGR